MNEKFSLAEGRVLHGLIKDASGDIVVRLDAAGFIVNASENARELGINPCELLLMPHIADLADAEYVHDVARHVAQVFAGECEAGWIEFPVGASFSSTPAEETEELRPSQRRWYALSLRLVEHEAGEEPAALGLLRSVQQRHSLEVEISHRALTDPMTGLANRSAFFGKLRRTIALGEQYAVAVLAVDRLRAIYMQYGQRTADEILWGFAKYLETMCLEDHELAQLDADRFAVLLPGMSVREARVWAEEVLETFSGLTVTSSKNTPELTASAGLAQVELSIDWTMRQAELGLVMAQAGGGMKIGICGQPPRAVASGTAVERAMRQAVEGAQKRFA